MNNYFQFGVNNSNTQTQNNLLGNNNNNNVNEIYLTQVMGDENNFNYENVFASRRQSLIDNNPFVNSQQFNGSQYIPQQTQTYNNNYTENNNNNTYSQHSQHSQHSQQLSTLTENSNSNFDEETYYKEMIHRSREQYDLAKLPILKLSQYRINHLNNETEIHQIYFITPFGLKGTFREAGDSLIKIGRLQLDEKGEVSNDIIIKDKTVSRNHCQIDFSDGFKKIEALPDEWLAFLMMNHQRLGRNINVPYLDHSNLLNICTYLTKKRQFYVKDCGSILGTYIRLRHNLKHEMKKGQIYSIGGDFVIIVNEIINSTSSNNEEFYRIINDMAEEISKGTHLIGVQQQLTEIIRNNNLEELRNFTIPSIMNITLNNINHEQFSKTLILVASENKQNFQIGRSGNCDITISDTTISREQTRINFNSSEKKWYIQDGSDQRESLNGTWFSLNNVWERMGRSETDKFPLNHGDEIKISDYLFKVEEVNVEKYFNK